MRGSGESGVGGHHTYFPRAMCSLAVAAGWPYAAAIPRLAPLGADEFITDLETTLERVLHKRQAGRERKSEEE